VVAHAAINMDDHFRTHLQDLIETTAQIHYEAFRSKQLLALKENARPQQA
jgi:septin 3/9/12